MEEHQEGYDALFDESQHQVNSEDEDYSDYPACGTTGDPSFKVQSNGEKNKKASNCDNNGCGSSNSTC